MKRYSIIMGITMTLALTSYGLLGTNLGIAKADEVNSVTSTNTLRIVDSKNVIYPKLEGEQHAKENPNYIDNQVMATDVNKEKLPSSGESHDKDVIKGMGIGIIFFAILMTVITKWNKKDEED